MSPVASSFPAAICWILCSTGVLKKIELEIELCVALPVSKFVGNPEKGARLLPGMGNKMTAGVQGRLALRFKPDACVGSACLQRALSAQAWGICHRWAALCPMWGE